MGKSKTEALEKLETLLDEMSKEEIEKIIYMIKNHVEISQSQQFLSHLQRL